MPTRVTCAPYANCARVYVDETLRVSYRIAVASELGNGVDLLPRLAVAFSQRVVIVHKDRNAGGQDFCGIEVKEHLLNRRPAMSHDHDRVRARARGRKQPAPERHAPARKCNPPGALWETKMRLLGHVAETG